MFIQVHNSQHEVDQSAVCIDVDCISSFEQLFDDDHQVEPCARIYYSCGDRDVSVDTVETYDKVRGLVSGAARRSVTCETDTGVLFLNS